ncbi:MAG: hypothetical protein ACR2J3_13550 [Aridibacter sp.]
MLNNLIVNPFTTLYLNEDYCRLLSPKPDSGLINFEFIETNYPQLFELFTDFAKIRLDLLDVENDLNNAERKLLYENGVLIDVNEIPVKPLFSCQLNEVEVNQYEHDLSSLKVNPTFRFEPLNTGNFNFFAHDNNLLPYQSSVWLKTLVSEIEIGYWLNNNQAEIVSRLKAGEEISIDIENELLNKLITADILISPQQTEQKRAEYLKKIQLIQEDFKENKYAVLHNLLPQPQIKAMQKYYREYVRNGFMPFNDEQVKRRYYQHNEPLAKFLHNNLIKIMSLIAGEEVKPSYVYAASYEEDAVLNPHTDRPQCEYSFSFQVDYQPEPENQISPWGLFVAEPDEDFDQEIGYNSELLPAENQTEDKNPAAYLANGDALVYKGCELIHYRYALPKGHKSTSLFFHYVPVNFEDELT